jgi:hypothetical protein
MFGRQFGRAMGACLPVGDLIRSSQSDGDLLRCHGLHEQRGDRVIDGVCGNRPAPGCGLGALVGHLAVLAALVRGEASPDDPAEAGYWAERRRKSRPPLDRSTLYLLQKQKGRRPICRDLLLHADREPQSPQEWERWHRTTRAAISRQHIANRVDGKSHDTRLVHSNCQRQTTGAQKGSAPLYS